MIPARDAEGAWQAIQVCWELSPEILPRELAGLAEACAWHGLHQGTIITFSEERTLDHRGLAVRVVPAWRWCTEVST